MHLSADLQGPQDRGQDILISAQFYWLDLAPSGAAAKMAVLEVLAFLLDNFTIL